MESAIDLNSAAVQTKKSQIAVDAEEELAKADLALHSETLKDTAPVLEGIKVNLGGAEGKKHVPQLGQCIPV